jgi:hypothetical protein
MPSIKHPSDEVEPSNSQKWHRNEETRDLADIQSRQSTDDSGGAETLEVQGT